MSEPQLTLFAPFRLKGEDVNIHINAKVVGDAAKINLFYAMLAVLDADCPLPQLFDYYHCNACNGDYWKAPALGPQELRALAKQCGVKIKIKRYSPASKCSTKSERFVRVDGSGEEEEYSAYGYNFG